MKKIIIIVLSVILGLVLLRSGYSLAKYTADSVWNYYLSSKGFYIASDQLNQENVNNVWDGNSVHFNLKNSLNDIVGTDYDIKYQVECTTDVGATCTVLGQDIYYGTLSSYNSCVNNIDDTDVSSLDKTNCEMQGYTWQTIPTTKDLYFDIVGDVKEVVATVTVTTIEPYKTTLQGTFTLTKDQSTNNKIILNYINDNLVISNSNDTNKCIKLKWDANKIRIDSDNYFNYQIDSNGYINEIDLKINAKDSIKYDFYKIDSTFDINGFSFEEIECTN